MGLPWTESEVLSMWLYAPFAVYQYFWQLLDQRYCLLLCWVAQGLWSTPDKEQGDGSGVFTV